MMIHVLSEQLASQIAAGEVVERPSSVVKELVENAVDAGATTINIDIREGGQQSIQVADNGQGIPADETETAFLRHATSKLSTVEDLNAIHTLGFRGEALAAIAAVSQITVVSRAVGETAGTRLTLAGGIKTSRETVGAPQGTVIAVENLFYNVPARLKFLKSANTERKLIDEFVTRYALAYPAIRFRLTHNGRITFQSSGSGSRLDVLVALYGPEIARQLYQLEPETDERTGLTVSGFVGPPSVHWSNRNHIVFFVNGRWVRDNQLTYAVIQAYTTLLPTGRYPLGILFLQLAPDQVDVNVHPTKTEVRFRQGRVPFSAVQRVVRERLVAEAPIRQMSAWALGSQLESMSPGWEGNLDQQAFLRPGEGAQEALRLDWSAEPDQETAVFPDDAEETGSSQLPIMRVVGQVGAAYIITEGPDGLFLIDQQAAHRRVLFDQYEAQWQAQQVKQVSLISGTAVTLAPAQADLLDKYVELLGRLGVQLEPFGPHTFMVRAVPAVAAACDAAQLVVQLMAALERGQHQSAAERDLALLQTVCQLAAIRAGQVLSAAEMTQLIQQLEACREPYTDPEGKPTFIYLSVAQLAREFGRI